MPELPDVERFRKYFDATSLHQKINGVEVKDKRILDCTYPQLKKKTIQQQFVSTGRIGKYLLADTDGGALIVFHFGMTGQLKYYKSEEDTPKFSQVLFKFENGFHLAVISRRKLGKIAIAESIEAFKDKKKLSDDALGMPFKTFKENLKGRKSAIKPLLQDQGVAAGIGNWIADEILFQAKVHPATPVKELDEKILKDIHHRMQQILKTAIAKNAEAEKFPSDYLFHHRKKGDKCPKCGGKVKKMELRKRATYFCPACQKL